MRQNSFWSNSRIILEECYISDLHLVRISEIWIGIGIAKSCAERHRAIWFERVGICCGGALRIDHKRRLGFMSQQLRQSSCIITIDPALYLQIEIDRQSFLITSFTHLHLGMEER
jgi:hypothetical protein